MPVLSKYLILVNPLSACAKNLAEPDIGVAGWLLSNNCSNPVK